MQRLVYKNPNGVEIDLTSGDFGVTSWDGFSDTTLEVQSQQVPFQDGSVYLDSLLSERELSVTVAVNDDNDLEKRYELKRQMITALNPKIGEGELIYTNDYLSKKIKCIPHLPKFSTKNINNSGTMKAKVDFTASNPYWEDIDETIISFNADEYVEIENNGDVPCNIEAKIFSHEADELVLNNFTNNKKIEIAGEYSKILLNTNPGKKIVNESVEKFMDISNSFTINNNNVILGKDIFILVGANTCYSLDGLNYIPIDVEGYTNNFDSVTFSKSKNFFIGIKLENRTSYLVFKSVDGITWKLLSRISFNELEAIVFWSESLSLFIVGSQRIYTSPDGEEWTQKTTLTNSITHFSESDEFVCGVGKNNSIVKTSDGETWSEQILNTSLGYNITWIDKFSKFFNFTETEIKSSVDGETWNVNHSGSYIHSLTFDSILERIIITDNDEIKESYNASTWDKVAGRHPYLYTYALVFIPYFNIFISQTYIFSENFNNREKQKEIIGTHDIAYAKDRDIICVLSSVGYSLIYDYKTKSWKKSEETFQAGDYARITYGKGFFWIHAYPKILKSSNGLNWTIVSDCEGGLVNKFYYSEETDSFIVIGKSGLLRVSFDDCLTWTDFSNLTSEDLYDVVSYTRKNVGVEIFISASNKKYLWTHNPEYWNVSTIPIQEVSNDIKLTGLTWCPSLEKLIFSSNGSTIIIKYGDEWKSVYTGLPGYTSKIKWSEELRYFILVLDTLNSVDKCLISFDAVNFYDLVFPNVGTPEDIEYIDSLNSFFICCGRKIYSSISSSIGNIIDSVSDNSDMDFYLENGNNLIKLNRNSGYANVVLSYKQKYLGV